MKDKIQIAIDGPVGSGKSTVSKGVADRLGLLYIDTGAMYRSVAFQAEREGVSWSDEEGVKKILPKTKIELFRPRGKKNDGRNVTIHLDGEDVSWELRKEKYGEGASVVSQYKSVRDHLVKLQREMARNESVIMEGRDIGTRVLPQAQIKIYLDAKVEERVKRKLDQLSKIGNKISFDQAKDNLMKRDTREFKRKIDPLRPAKGAWILDTTDLSIEQVIDRITKRVAKL